MRSSRPLQVVVGDERPVVRNGLCNALRAADGLHVVGVADSGAATLGLVRGRRPDVVIADADAVDLPAFELIRKLRDSHRTPPPAVIALSAQVDASSVFTCLSAGAMGFLLKTAEPQEIVAATRSVADGDAVLAPAVAGIILDWFFQRRPLPDCACPSPISALSEREREVLRLLALGFTDREMASQLGIGVATIRTHTHRLRQKLNLSKRTELMVFAYQVGLPFSPLPQFPPLAQADLSPC